MLIRSRAPLRLGLAGGGTDVSPYSDQFGGAILNATINQYAHASIEPRLDGKIAFRALDIQDEQTWPATSEFPPTDNRLALHAGVYNRIVRQFTNHPLAFTLTTHVDAPPGSGLGSSSTLVVAILGAFVEWLGLPLGEYEIAHLAFEIERIDLGMSGGKQDQYAAAFGGFNFMEFHNAEKVIVNPLRIRGDVLRELEACILLYQTGQSRISSQIITEQVKNVLASEQKSIEAMHHLKEQAVQMKEALLTRQLRQLGQILDFGWNHKKAMAHGISNAKIDNIYDTAIRNGATGGKISGAGGGGHAIFYCPGHTRFDVEAALRELGGECKRFQFVKEGLISWRAE